MVLETERLILREYELSDADDIVEGLNNIEVSKYLANVPYPYTKANAERYIKSCQSEVTENRTDYNWVIVLKSENKVIGAVSLQRVNRLHGVAGGGGIWLNKNYHGKGYAVEAYSKRTEFAFETLGLRRIDNGYFEGNVHSAKLHQKLGYKIEGMRREAFICAANGQIVNEITVGLLKSEWVRSK
jgi:RimJ/RimL family protein N-acetyltransferase